MLRNIAVLVLLAGLGVTLYLHRSQFLKPPAPVVRTPSVSPESPEPRAKRLPVKETKAVFVPYWSLPIFNTEEVSIYDRLFYFGITATTTGINKNEAGYRGLSSFSETAQGKNTYLTLRMLDSDINNAVLSNSESQTAIIEETLEIAKSFKFKGIVLDLEVVTPLDDKMMGRINDFVQKFYTAAKRENSALILAIYGDTAYRKRPYDLPFLSINSDEILVMAYDFHKSRGEPGPNFPLNGKDKYGYTFTDIIADFTRAVPPEKLTVTFGMFGYDWKVDEQKRPLTSAKAMSLKDIKKEFLNNCQWKNCLATRDSDSAETEVNYVEEPYQLHIVWFEDEESVEVKSNVLKEKGIGSTAYWVYGYF